MNEEVCQYFKMVWDDFPDTLDNDGNYDFETSGFCDTYCDYDCDKNCDSDLDKFNAGCLHLFKTFFKDSVSFNSCANKSTDIVQYIWAWLGHILSLKENEGIININGFYEKYIKDKNMYNNHITGVNGYTSYSDLIDKNKELMTVDIKGIPKFYTLVQTLCKMYIECNEKTNDCTKFSKYAEEFSNKYNELNCNSDTNINRSYSKILSTLLTDYNNFKKQFSEKCRNCSNSTTLPDIKTTNCSVQNNAGKTVQDNAEKTVQDSTEKLGHDNTGRSAQGDTESSVDSSPPGHVGNPVNVSEFTSSNSSTSSKLIPVLSIFVYSLFGIDKLFQRQYLRTKLKKVKKKLKLNI
ncbi:PIR protein CIR protein [Plasmodium vinckei brucechwatti]|uniref:PIR protein CIR protein n=1 Tax=Plasmodium vinckei brucechwatti TaxID=119398 RepID=A0A6V7RWD2_PLAVN|nr:PIR protein CIR protein [Plasmodium vinckei brucechwatti]